MIKRTRPTYNLYARQYQRELGTVTGHLKLRKIPPDIDLLALRKVMTVRDMAAKFECSQVCVYRWLRMAKVKHE